MLYKTKVVIGAQWGDEGKGKISDYLAQKADVVVRYQGGNNAGHTIVFDGNRYALRHIPSGIFNPKIINVMAQGMVINPKMLLEELAELEAKGIFDYKLVISDRAHVILPYHLDLDEAYENLKKSVSPKKMIGTTKKGIGPAYEDKAGRIGIRFGDFINENTFREMLQDTLLIKNKILKAFNIETYTVDQIVNEYKHYASALASKVVETGALVAEAANNGKKIIFEGAQGVMLCIDNGTYPYVTSSSPTASAIPLAVGINCSYIKEVIGVVKTYTTRVGTGAMPTSIEKTNPIIANHIRKKGHEYGTVTGRARLIGWLDTMVIKHASRVSGFTHLSIMLLDVLDEQEIIKIGYAYELNGKEINYIPGSNDIYEKVKVKYLEMPGWKSDITHVKSWEELPINAQNYLRKIQDLVGIPIKYFSVGPDRKQTIEILI